jgi:membrane fusion protein (multidrug efflux system)
MSKVLKRILTLVIVLVVLGIIFYPKLSPLLVGEAGNESGGRGPGGPGGGRPLLTVSAVIVKPQLLENKVAVTGEIVPNEFLELKSEVSGKINGIFFQEGQAVKKGQLLLKVNVDELLAQLDKVKFTTKLREDTEFRQRQLLEKEAISQEEYELALTELQTSNSDIRLLETQIAKSEIRAPFDGIVGFREISEGAYVIPSTILTSLYSIQPAKIQFSIPGKYSNQVKKGSPIAFKIDAVDDVFKGEVYVIEPRLNSETRTLTLRALSPNPSNILLPGQFVRVELILDTKEGAIMVPSEAVIPELVGSKVFVSKGGKVVPVAIETGYRTDTDLEILSGLHAGDTVITSGILQVRQGMQVNIQIQN